MSHIHYGATFSARIIPGKTGVIKDLLARMNEEGVEHNSLFPFGQLKDTHFVSWVILPSEVTNYGRELPERLLLITSYVGSRKAHFRDLVNIGKKGLIDVYKNCEEFSGNDANEINEQQLLRFIKKISVKNTYYTGFQYINQEDVGRERKLRDAIQDFLDDSWKNKEWSEDSDPVMVRDKIQEYVKQKPELSWALRPYKRSTGDFIRLFGALILFLVVLGASLILSIVSIFLFNAVTIAGLIVFFGFILTIIFLLLWLRINESQPHIKAVPASDERIFEIVSKENYPVKNEMTVAGPLKKGLIRRIFLAFTLRIVPMVRAFSYIPTVHTARWLQVDGGRRIVFIAYFDNTSEGYAHDFVDSTKRTRNLNLIFGHGQGFPATKFAVIGGGKDRKQYITAVRATQQITQLWYSTYQKLGVLNINNNREIRQGLFADLEQAEVKNWLLKL